MWPRGTCMHAAPSACITCSNTTCTSPHWLFPPRSRSLSSSARRKNGTFFSRLVVQKLKLYLKRSVDRSMRERKRILYNFNGIESYNDRGNSPFARSKKCAFALIKSTNNTNDLLACFLRLLNIDLNVCIKGRCDKCGVYIIKLSVTILEMFRLS